MADGQIKFSTAAVEMAGRNWLTVQLLRRGFEVAIPAVDRGIDLIVFREIGEAGIRALPLQLKCASAESFSLDRKYEGRGIPLIYIWNSLDQPVALIMDYEEALVVLGERATSRESWIGKGNYAITSVSVDLRARLEPFRSRWDWLEARLEAQPPSGSPTRAAEMNRR